MPSAERGGADEPLLAILRARIRRDGPLPRRLSTCRPASPIPSTAIGARRDQHRRRRRFHHRARDQPGVRRADRPVVRGGLAEDGAAGAAAAGRAGAGTRHADARCAARGAGACRRSSMRSACIWSRSARRCARRSGELSPSLARSSAVRAVIAWHESAGRCAGRAGDRHRQRVPRRPADPAARVRRRRVARARRRARRATARCGSPSAPATLRTCRGRQPAGRATIARAARRARTSCSPSWRARAAPVRRALHRLRPGRSGLRRYAAGRAPARLRRSAGRARRRRPDRACAVRARWRARRARRASPPTVPCTQAEFLGALGIAERAARLMAANPDAAGEIEAAVQRLISPTGMGQLFKVLAVRSPAPSAAVRRSARTRHARSPSPPTALPPCPASRTASSRATAASRRASTPASTAASARKDDPRRGAREPRARRARISARRDLVTAHQVHSATAVVVDGLAGREQRPRADAIVTATPRPGARRADGRLRAGAVRRPRGRRRRGRPCRLARGARRVSWRRRIAAMGGWAPGGSASRAAVGPCIGQPAYEVGSEFEQQFLERDPAAPRFFSAPAAGRAAAFRSCRATSRIA